LSVEAVKDLGNQLHGIGQRYHPCFTTLRHDTSAYALIYLKGLMLLPNNRNYVNIMRQIESPDSDGQNLQNYMSDSPWPALLELLSVIMPPISGPWLMPNCFCQKFGLMKRTKNSIGDSIFPKSVSFKPNSKSAYNRLIAPSATACPFRG